MDKIEMNHKTHCMAASNWLATRSTDIPTTHILRIRTPCTLFPMNHIFIYKYCIMYHKSRDSQ